MGGVKADGWIYKWESCLSESGKKALSSARSFSHFPVLLLFRLLQKKTTSTLYSLKKTTST